MLFSSLSFLQKNQRELAKMKKCLRPEELVSHMGQMDTQTQHEELEKSYQDVVEGYRRIIERIATHAWFHSLHPLRSFQRELSSFTDFLLQPTRKKSVQSFVVARKVPTDNACPFPGRVWRIRGGVSVSCAWGYMFDISQVMPGPPSCFLSIINVFKGSSVSCSQSVLKHFILKLKGVFVYCSNEVILDKKNKK